LDKPLLCRMCKKSTASKKWACSCNIPWHLCERHIPGTTPAIKNPLVIKAIPMRHGYTESYCNSILDKEVQREAKRAKKAEPANDNPIITPAVSSLSHLRITPGMLPASLRERFPSICATHAQSPV
jgi:hypothetical protein